MIFSGITFNPDVNHPQWFVADRDFVVDEMQDMARNWNRLPGDYFAICGATDGDARHRFYLVPRSDPLEIARAFGVGCESVSPETVASSLQELATLHAKNALLPFYVDGVGFKCELSEPITDEVSELLIQTLVSGIDAMQDENGEILPSIRQRGYIELRWS